MRDAILGFPEQFTYEPEIINGEHFGKFNKFVLLGMGGSHLAGGILGQLDPYLDILIHRDYGLPSIREEDLHGRLIIASSYSGNTEEVLSGFEAAFEEGLSVVAVSTGGALLARAKEAKIPYIQLPDKGIQPRSALGLSLRALMKLLRLEMLLKDSMHLSRMLDAKALEEEGKSIAETLKGKVPVIYAANRNKAVAYNWKIKFNETGKIPAFMNILPELNHNEMTGFDVTDATQKLSERFHFLFLSDESDHPKVQRRMHILKDLYEARGLSVTGLSLMGSSPMEKIFKSLLIADFAALHTAEFYGMESEQVPMVEEFKKMIAE